MSTIARRLKDESGVAMIVAMGVMFVLMVLTGVVVSSAVNESSASRHDSREKRAFEAAQAGLQETLYRMNMVLNSNSVYAPTTLQTMCLGGQISTNGTVTLNAAQLENPATFYASLDCGPYTESLGNGAFYTSWTSVAYVSNQGTCAGASIGTNNLVAERCITSEGIACPGPYTNVSQLPCPGEVTNRVEERVASYAGKPAFPLSGVFGLNGVLVENSAQLLSTNGAPVVETNKQLEVKNSAQVTGPATLAPSAPNPIIQQTASLGSAPACTATSVTFPTNCVQRATSPYVPSPVAPPPAACGATACSSSSTPVFTQPDGDARISNAFSPSFSNPTNPHDSFTGCNSAASCGWNPQTRSLSIPNGVTWTMGGGTYNFCNLSLSGQATATLPAGVRSAIYIDSKVDDSTCPSTPGSLSIGNQAQFVNNSPKLPGSPLLHDTTALEIWVFGPSDVSNPTYNNNSCVNNSSDPTCVLLGNKGDFYGTVYAPTSDISVSNQGNTFGAILGSTVLYNNPGSFQQDVNVPSLVTTGILGVYFRTAWSECGVPSPTGPNAMAGC
ncbi:MAG: hypothetical protein ACR2JH_03005 [Solirubrobacteraceae bacterium]